MAITALIDITQRHGSGSGGGSIPVPLPVNQGGTGTTVTFTPGSVVFAGGSGIYSQDNANFFWDDSNNRLGIGTNAPSYQLQVAGEAQVASGLTLPSNGNVLLRLGDVSNPPASNWSYGLVNSSVLSTIPAAGAYYGIWLNPKNTSPGTQNFISGIHSTAESTTDITQLEGFGGGAMLSNTSGAATLSLTMRGGTFSTSSSGGGAKSVADALGVWVYQLYTQGPITIANNYGVKIDNNTTGDFSPRVGNYNAAQVANQFGFYYSKPGAAVSIGFQAAFYSEDLGSGATDYALYLKGASTQSYIAGKLGIGTTAPNLPLTVAGAGVVGSLVADSSNPSILSVGDSGNLVISGSIRYGISIAQLTTSSNKQWYGVYSSSQYQGAASSGYNIAGYFSAATTSNLARLAGVSATAYVPAATAVAISTGMRAADLTVRTDGVGTKTIPYTIGAWVIGSFATGATSITSNYGVKVDNNSAGLVPPYSGTFAAATVVNQFGYYYSAPDTPGGISNQYAYFSEDIGNNTNFWQLYLDGPTCRSYIGGRLGIGINTPAAPLDVASNAIIGSGVSGVPSTKILLQLGNDANTQSSTNRFGLSITQAIANQAAAGGWYGVYSDSPHAGSAVSGFTVGGLFRGSSSTAINNVTGLAASAAATGSGAQAIGSGIHASVLSIGASGAGAKTIPYAIGAWVIGQYTGGTATITNNYGIKLDFSGTAPYPPSQGNLTAAAITNQFGLYYQCNSAGWTNQYAIYLDDTTSSATAWQLYCAGASAKSFIEGKLGIGITSPLAPLHTLNIDNGSAAFPRGVMAQEVGNWAGALFLGRRSRGTDVTAPTAVQTGDYGASLINDFYDGTAYRSSGYLAFIVENMVSANNVPTEFAIATGINNSSTEWTHQNYLGVMTGSGQHRASAYNTADYTIATATPTALTFDSESFDTGGLHSTSVNTSRFTVPSTTLRAGTYWVLGQVRWTGSNTGTERNIYIRKGGTTTLASNVANPSANPLTMQVSCIVSLSASEYVEVIVSQDSGSNKTVTGGDGITFAQIMRLW